MFILFFLLIGTIVAQPYNTEDAFLSSGGGDLALAQSYKREHMIGGRRYNILLTPNSATNDLKVLECEDGNEVLGSREYQFDGDWHKICAGECMNTNGCLSFYRHDVEFGNDKGSGTYGKSYYTSFRCALLKCGYVSSSGQYTSRFRNMPNKVTAKWNNNQVGYFMSDTSVLPVAPAWSSTGVSGFPNTPLSGELSGVYPPSNNNNFFESSKYNHEIIHVDSKVYVESLTPKAALPSYSTNGNNDVWKDHIAVGRVDCEAFPMDVIQSYKVSSVAEGIEVCAKECADHYVKNSGSCRTFTVDYTLDKATHKEVSCSLFGCAPYEFRYVQFGVKAGGKAREKWAKSRVYWFQDIKNNLLGNSPVASPTAFPTSPPVTNPTNPPVTNPPVTNPTSPPVPNPTAPPVTNPPVTSPTSPTSPAEESDSRAIQIVLFVLSCAFIVLLFIVCMQRGASTGSKSSGGFTLGPPVIIS